FPFMDQNTSDMTLTASATTGVITITASEDFFDEGHRGTFFAFQDSGTVGIVYVTNVKSATEVDAVVYRTLPAAAANGTTQWFECAWSDYRGWPRTVAYWNGALYFGGSPTFPDMIWKSQTFDLFEMSNVNVLNPGG